MFLQQKGFTLIELMMVVAIAAIVAAFAVVSYSTYVVRSELQDAFSNLSSFRLQMEQYYQDNGSYGSSACGVSMAASKYFSYQCASANAGQNYTITATGNGTGGVTSGYVYTITDANVQSTTGYPGATIGLPQACWLTNPGGC
jgi:type IV pilus assembly protein PilE